MSVVNEHHIVEKDLSYKLVGIFFKVHRALGRYCRERQYADALEQALRREHIRYRREHALPIAGINSNRVDFYVEDRILVDLKAKPFIKKEDYYQMRRYLEGANAKLGFIVNFRTLYLHPKRVLNPRCSQYPPHTNIRGIHIYS